MDGRQLSMDVVKNGGVRQFHGTNDVHSQLEMKAAAGTKIDKNGVMWDVMVD